jgi:hypothetical protein
MPGELYTAGKIAEQLKLPAAKVKTLLEALKIKPDSVKGPCKYYGTAALARIKAAAK